jgi:tripartite-type tricarboxylate transporter receptor subunit TctC
MFAPAGTPKDIVARLQREITMALKDPAIVKSLNARGFSSEGTTPEQFDAMVKQNIAQWAKVVAAAGLAQSAK